MAADDERPVEAVPTMEQDPDVYADGRFRPADLLTQAMIQELTVTPDGSAVIYARRVIEDNAYRKRLWRVGFDGGAPEPLTTADANDSRPRVSPDGRTLLFLSDRSGRNQPWVLPLAGGEAQQLADVPGDARAAEWSPDGQRVLVVASSGEERYIVGDPTDPVARHITDFRWRLDGQGFRDQSASAYVVPAAGGKPVRLTEPAVEVVEAFWLPDGARIGFVADLESDDALATFPPHARIWSVPADEPGPAPEQVASLEGTVAAARWSPSSALAMVGIDHHAAPAWANQNLYLVDGDGTRQLGPDLDRPITNTTFGDLIDPNAGVVLEWLDDRTIVALVSDAGRSLPYRFGVDGSVEQMADGEVVCTAVATGGGRVVVVATDRGRPGEVCAVEDGVLRPLTTHGSDWLAPFRKDPVRHRVPHPEGHTIDVWFIEGRDAPWPGPVALQIHGGPHGAHGPTPWLEMLALADAGIHVLYPNPRGSTGYGEAFARAIHGIWGDPDASDNVRVVEWAIAEGIADPKRVGVFGLSGGGYMTTWLLGHDPGTFAAGVSENPVTDLVSWYGSSDLPTFTGERFVGVGALPEDLAAFQQRSPFVEIHRNEAPLLLLQCEGDLRCPPNQTELVYAILRSRRRPVEMVRYPSEAHFMAGVGRPDRRVDRIERIVDWFHRYL
ncbi:MAG: S9 family peptidase [Chloroflexota bacterium]|nr:S9 family peptidase [Chloroflexota bacterium]MDP9470769.1 S9 family peptidase [Chloroflexota bacterium]